MGKHTIFISNQEDRLKVVQILASNGYAVRITKIKDSSGKLCGAVEYWIEK
jgi:hypothetical protein